MLLQVTGFLAFTIVTTITFSSLLLVLPGMVMNGTVQIFSNLVLRPGMAFINCM